MKDFFSTLKAVFDEAFAKNKRIAVWRGKHPRLFAFVGRRLSSKEYYGIRFTVGVLVSAAFWLFFLSLIQDVVERESIVSADTSILNQLVAFRTPAMANFLLFFTYLGNWEVLTGVVAVSVMIFGLFREWRKIIFFLVAIGVAELTVEFFKLLLQRSRPDSVYSLLSGVGGYSFPSGHALSSFVIYGLLGFFLFQYFVKWRWRFVIIITDVALLFLIGFSRIYLGVHWFSDVVAGWAAAVALLAIVITFYLQQQKFFPKPKTPPAGRKYWS